MLLLNALKVFHGVPTISLIVYYRSGVNPSPAANEGLGWDLLLQIDKSLWLLFLETGATPKV